MLNPDEKTIIHIHNVNSRESTKDKIRFERLYAVRLERLRSLDECLTLLAPLDYQGLLTNATTAPEQPAVEDGDDDALLAALGVTDEASSITELRHVRSTAEKRLAEEGTITEYHYDPQQARLVRRG